MRRAIIYCRVSTKAQEDGESLDDQERVCREYASREGYEVAEVFRESKSGELLSERPVLDRVRREFVWQEAVDALIVKSTDRLSRDPVHTLLIAQECDKHSVNLAFVKEPADWSLEGKLLTFVRGWASQLENVRKVERQRIGKVARAREGYLTQGGGQGLYGYRHIARDRGRKRHGLRVIYGPDPGKRLVYEPEADVVRLIFSLLVEKGLSLRKIAAHLAEKGIPAPEGDTWHAVCLSRMMRRDAYVGDAGPHTPAIIDRRTFDLAQQQLSRNKEMATRNRKYFSLLRGHIWCHCGLRMYGCCGAGISYYRCAGRWKEARTKCDAPAIRAEHLDPPVWEFIDSIFRDPAVMGYVFEAKERPNGDDMAVGLRIREIDRKMKSLKAQEQRLVTMLRYGEIDEKFILQETRRLKAEEKELGRQRKDLLALEAERQNGARLRDAFAEFRDRWLEGVDDFTNEDKLRALETLRVRATVNPDGTVSISAAVPVIVEPSRISIVEQAGR